MVIPPVENAALNERRFVSTFISVGYLKYKENDWNRQKKKFSFRGGLNSISKQFKSTLMQWISRVTGYKGIFLCITLQKSNSYSEREHNKKAVGPKVIWKGKATSDFYAKTPASKVLFRKTHSPH